MELKVNGVALPVLPLKYQMTVMDLDNAETTVRTLDGRLHRDRIAVKRQIELTWSAMKWEDLSEILQMMSEQWFEFYYPDTLSGLYETRTFYAGNRSAIVAIEKGGTIWWDGLRMILTEE